MVFGPFAAGYFLSFFFRNVNAVISKDLAQEFDLTPSDLGFLTSMYLLAFAAFQLPLGVLLDRYGPRRVVAALLCVAAAGALVFALARDFTMLSIGRALLGLGVSAGLMGAIKAFTLWFPLSRLATLNGLYLAAGGIGGLSATAPAEALIGPFGWRALFFVLFALSLLASLLVFFVVPEKPLPGSGQTLRSQIAGFNRIFASSREGSNTWDGFQKGEEVGTFYGYLNFLTAGEWAMAVQFRTDSTLPLQRVDWIQEVRPERPLGS